MVIFAAATRAQDGPRPFAVNPVATVHQFGIVRSGEDISADDLLDLPEFVHRANLTTSTADNWLEFSALYFIPPQMTTAPMVFDVRTSSEAGVTSWAPTAWYPYATMINKASAFQGLRWNDIYIGVLAEGLKTEHPIWMTARSMEAAATVKVHKPGPPGSKPDDEGTTEGDVFVFMRGSSLGNLAGLFSAELNSETQSWQIVNRILSESSVPFSFTSSTVHAWLAEPDADEIISRRVTLDSSGVGFETSATVALEPYSRRTAMLRAQLNEAIVGNGLRPDEAAAQADLVLRSIHNIDGPVMIYLLPPDWIDARFPLEIDGPAREPVRVYMVILELPVGD